MRLSRQFQTFLFFFTRRFHTHKKHKTHISEQKQKRQHFYPHKKHLREGKSLLRLFASLRFLSFLCFLCFLCFFLCVKFSRKKTKKFKIVLMASFPLLLNLSYTNMKFFSIFFNLFFFITIFFNHHNLF